ncbi:TIGR03088 family PEP-CTERM/XrtA system glycosyltransferase [Pseudoduganella namucuonensis]|uniref:Sugar transferase, PEP-CTERM/EpsH1 system associated n=1 Tax=Pseudoduganella namucuonensis TaxID=1035707 RepID=A0A1I7GFG2_9BURK|nr:TIGR03088 family PEP-CTERM/XrtA system glycosyltransferase [Pseudoduganella namucuonensis]SFU47148.1 sugar transferase, PEP-CTERM/EpsH1 system associated [Pseudoduganella namucuonensis]
MTDKRPLVVHLVYALDVGGLETLLVDCINRMPAHKYRHAVVCLTRYTDFAAKITQPGVTLHALNKPPGLAPAIHWKLWRLLRRLRPAVLHTYNLATLEYALPAALAGTPVRIHAEHGRDASDPQGLNPKHNLLRRLMRPFVDRYIPVSDDLQRWLDQVVRIPGAKSQLIKNGVDTEKYCAAPFEAGPSPWSAQHFVIGTVARIQDIKNHAGLVRAFAALRERLGETDPARAARLRLSIVGDGPLLPALRLQVAQAGLEDLVWLPGARADIAALLHGFSLFALPSFAEGTPVSLLEAMSCALPVVASRVGGIPEVVTEGVHGTLVPPDDTAALAAAMALYATQPALAREHGAAGRLRVIQHYSMAAMLDAYVALYDALREQKTGRRAAHAV